MLVSAAGFGSGTVLAAPIYRTGVDWLDLVGWRFLVGAQPRLGMGRCSRPGGVGVRAAMPRRQVAVALALGTITRATPAPTTPALETVPAALAGVLVYIVSGHRRAALAAFRDPLPGRRPCVALVLALAGVVLAVGGVDVGPGAPITGLLLILAAAAIYSVWIVLSARLSGERRDRLGAEAPDAAEPAE